jgi:hypothetical protein
MVIQDNVGIFTYKEALRQRNIFLGQSFNLLKKYVGVDYYGICDYADNIRPNRAAGQQMQSEFVTIYDNSMAGIGASIISNDDVAVLGKDINNLAFALIAPLQSDNTRIHSRPDLEICRQRHPKINRNSSII